MIPNKILTHVISLFLSTSFLAADTSRHYNECRRPFTCGTNTRLTYPFWTGDDGRPEYCGGGPGFRVDCGQNNNFPTVEIAGEVYNILQIDQTNRMMSISRSILVLDSICSGEIHNATGSITSAVDLFRPIDSQKLIMLYGCAGGMVGFLKDAEFRCANGRNIYYADETFLSGEKRSVPCSSRVEVEMASSVISSLYVNHTTLRQALTKALTVEYVVDNPDCSECTNSGGLCGSDSSGSRFNCICPRGPPFNVSIPCPPPRGKRRDLTLMVAGIMTAAAAATTTLMCILLVIRRRRIPVQVFRTLSSIKGLKKGSGTYLGVQIFSYSELEEATNNFGSSRELGDGGFGTVYYGKLADGRSIAVKRLLERNYRSLEQFINEVEILARLRHENLVTLYGCTSRHSRELLLVYEYVSNGTVADHLHGGRSDTSPLTWPVRLGIAIETAAALSYLHASDVIHRDVKTNNILLHHDFSVKLADFGLSRSLSADMSHISTAPQGTPGYVDPEYHMCYQLSDKSDVYSFGVVLIELISSMPAVDLTRRRDEIRLSDLAINRIQNDALAELVDPSLGFEIDEKVARTVTAMAELAFLCLQSDKALRPVMDEVLEALNSIRSRSRKPETIEVEDDALVVVEYNK